VPSVVDGHHTEADVGLALTRRSNWAVGRVHYMGVLKYVCQALIQLLEEK
jgi:hypothetical protein